MAIAGAVQMNVAHKGITTNKEALETAGKVSLQTKLTAFNIMIVDNNRMNNITVNKNINSHKNDKNNHNNHCLNNNQDNFLPNLLTCYHNISY